MVSKGKKQSLSTKVREFARIVRNKNIKINGKFVSEIENETKIKISKKKFKEVSGEKILSSEEVIRRPKRKLFTKNKD